MKALICFFIAFSTLTFARAETDEVFCSLYHFKKVRQKARLNSSYDKNLHCSVSCMLSLRCPYSEVARVGVMKEIGDLLGLGDPDLEDIRANFYGIGLVYRREALSDGECMRGCNLQYSGPRFILH